MILLLVSYCMLSPALERGEEFDNMTSEATHATAWTENTSDSLNGDGKDERKLKIQ